MPVETSVVGCTSECDVEVDARWVMAYSAGLGDDLDLYLDTARPGGIRAHPFFPVCLEWRAFEMDGMAGPGLDGLSEAELLMGVHAAYDLEIHQLVRPGATYTVRREIVGVEERPSGAWVTTETRGLSSGEPVWTSWSASVFRGVGVNGSGNNGYKWKQASERPGEDADHFPMDVPSNAAHVYSECSRIWNPIHTDRRVAIEAGLPGTILHGTATLAYAVSQIVRRRLGNDPRRLGRIACRFTDVVFMPSVLTVGVGPTREGVMRFEVLGPGGERVLAGGRLRVGR